MIPSIITGDRGRRKHNMAWERRRNGTYYYRTHKRHGRVVKEYVGSGPFAEIAAEHDALARTARAEDAETQRRARAEIREFDATVEVFAGSLETLTRASLLLAGYHRHHGGEWRKRRHG
jgi:hypothetical protein